MNKPLIVLHFEDGYPTVQEKKEFVNYLLSFYAEDPKYDPVYPEVAMTEEDAIKFTEQYLDGDFPCIQENWMKDQLGNPIPTHLWGGGDSIDREKVCQLFLDSKENV